MSMLVWNKDNANWETKDSLGEIKIDSELLATVSYHNNYIYDTIDTCYFNKPTKLEPLICERCGGSINPNTLKCEHCGIYYREVAM